MKKFEAFYQVKYDYYERYWDTEKKDSFISKIPLVPETFIESPDGDHTFVIDSSIKLKRVPKKSIYGQNLKTYGSNSVGLEWIRQQYWSFEGSNYNDNPRVWYLDIETTAHGAIDTVNCPEQIVSIQIYDTFLNTNFIFCLEDFDIASHTSANGKYTFDNREYDFVLKYKKFENEIQLLKAYFQMVSALKPLIVMAHNGRGFDYAYLWKRTKRYDLEEGFSPFADSRFEEYIGSDGSVDYQIRAPGVFYTDSIRLYKKFAEDTRKEKSYSLDYLCQIHLGETKVNHDCYRSFDGFRTGKDYIRPEVEPPKESTLEYLLYNAKSQTEIEKISKEWFIHYSIIDTYLLYKLISRVKISDVMVQIASMMGCQIDQSVGVISPWNTYIRNYALTRKQVMPDKLEHQDYEGSAGGFVKEPNAGKYGWTFSVDVTSMYPSQFMAFNISSDTFIPFHKVPQDLQDAAREVGLGEDEDYHIKEYTKNPQKYEKYSALLRKYNLCGTMIGTFFTKEYRGILPTLIEYVFNARKADKKKMLEYQEKYEKSGDIADKDMMDRYYLHQLVKKILSCAIYGANGNPHFILFNDKLVGSVTGNARFYVNLMAHNIEQELQRIKPQNREYLAYCDTDSCGEATAININEEKMSIGDFYDISKGTEVKQNKDNFIKILKEDYLTPSVSKGFEIQNKRVTYIKKHKVKKELYKIKILDKEVVITGDHSLMASESKNLIPLKIRDLRNYHNLLFKIGKQLIKTKDYSIESLGIQEEFVYDLEVQDNHNFFGNDILLHNSNFFAVPEPLIDPKLTINEQTDRISDWVESDIQPLINLASKQIGEVFNALEPQRISAKREGISDAGVFIAKKRYFMRVWDSEFVRFKDPHIKATGIELIRSSTPKFSQIYLDKAIDVILDKNEDDLRKWLKEIKELYKKQPLMDIAKTSSVNNIKYKITDKGIPINSRAFLATNNFIAENKLENSYQSLIPGEKVKMLYLRTPNPLKQNVFAFSDEKFAQLFKNYIDWDANFDKFFLAPLALMVKPIGYNLEKQEEVLDLW